MRKTPVVLGVLSIIFGALTAVWSLGGAFLGPMFKKLGEFTANLPGQTELQRAQMEAANEAFAQMSGYMKLSSLVFLVMSVWLVVVGVGLYRRRAWARRATVAWALAGLVLVVGNTILSIAWLQPHQRAIQEAVFARHGVTPPFAIGAGAQATMTILGMLIYVAYPTVLLALIGRRSAVNDLSPAA